MISPGNNAFFLSLFLPHTQARWVLNTTHTSCSLCHKVPRVSGPALRHPGDFKDLRPSGHSDKWCHRHLEKKDYRRRIKVRGWELKTKRRYLNSPGAIGHAVVSPGRKDVVVRPGGILKSSNKSLLMLTHSRMVNNLLDCSEKLHQGEDHSEDLACSLVKKTKDEGCWNCR